MARTATAKKPPLDRELLQQALAKAEADKARLIAETRLASYVPYKKQMEWHRSGGSHRERLLMASSRFGKTVCGAAEMAFHLTGSYPEWWSGKRFDKPVRAWAAGVTNESTRDVVQEKLIGPPFRQGEWGTGMIPRGALGSVETSRGTPGLIDTVQVRHISGGWSSLQFKSYERGREKWQGVALEVAWFDEEPPIEIYMEGLTRTNETGGITYVTFTPLLGTTETVKRFTLDPSPDRAVINATIDDAPHFTAADKAMLEASYAPHEREARMRGVPVMGSGRVFTHAEESLLVDPFERPRHWPRIGGMDFGWTHYFAACELWWDRDLDKIYLVRTLRLREQTPLQHCEALRPWRLQWAWPADGRSETLAGAGIPLMQQYRNGSLDMLSNHAQFERAGNETTGGTSVEAGIQLMNDRMLGNRWKVFKGANEGWLEEYRLYHRDSDGKLVKKNDDAISASRYALMMLRYAMTDQGRSSLDGPINYPQVKYA
jgi:phage terminase large subunit-like protein